MKRIISVLLALILICSAGISAFAAEVTNVAANATRDAAKTVFENTAKTKFDVNGTSSINAADARATLLASAGLSENGIDTSKMDADGDGMVTAIDARIILRISAQLDSVYNYMQAEKLDYFNAILNTAKPNRYLIYYNGIDKTESITYTDPNNVMGKVDTAFKTFDKSFNFADSLVSGAGEEIYDNKNTMVGGTANAKYRMMEICNSNDVNENQSSYLTVDDVSEVIFKTNQTYTFIRYGTTKNSDKKTVVDRNNTIYSETVNDLNAITVRIKADNDVRGVHTSKVFSIFTQEEFDSEVQKIASKFSEMSTELDSLVKGVKFDVKPGVGDVRYHGGEITVYFKPDDATIVAAVYSIFTDYTMKLDMDVDIDLLFLDVAGPVNITDVTKTTKEYYFIKNNPAHVDWKAS